MNQSIVYEGTYNIEDGPRELGKTTLRTVHFGICEEINLWTNGEYYKGYHVKGSHHNPLFSFPAKEDKIEDRLKYFQVPQNKIDYLLGRIHIW